MYVGTGRERAECLDQYDERSEIIIKENLKPSLQLGKEGIIVLCKFLLHGALDKLSPIVRVPLQAMV